VPVPVPPVFAIEGIVRDYAWGSTTVLQQLLGLPLDGRPAAELWLGAHPDDPSFAPELGISLDEVIAAEPGELLGAATLERFGPRLPFLLKLLAAEKSISMQVHPNLAQAREGYARENAAGLPAGAPERNYRDPNHKPELVCAVSDFEALCGFRPVADTLRLLDEWALPELEPIRELLAGPDGLRVAFTHLLTLPDPALVVTAVVKRAAEVEGGEWVGVARAVGLIDHDFPGDVGAALALLLNYLVLAPGEALYLGAGNVHAYLRGFCVEILANSDNVLRCALTPKHVDVEELLRVTDFSELAEPRWPARYEDRGLGFAAPVADFALHVLAGGAGVVHPGPSIVLCLDAALTVRADDTVVELGPGRAAFVRAGQSVGIDGPGRAFLATTG
jgi:mannose-6-phosphate isomerase